MNSIKSVLINLFKIKGNSKTVIGKNIRYTSMANSSSDKYFWVTHDSHTEKHFGYLSQVSVTVDVLPELKCVDEF